MAAVMEATTNNNDLTKAFAGVMGIQAGKNMQSGETVDPQTCKHVYEFIECLGTFCINCSIPYGEACLRPDCNVMDCTKHTLTIPACSEEQSFITIIGRDGAEPGTTMNDDIYLLHLGHDGIIEGKDEDVRQVLSYKGLRVVEYCGYYTADNVREVFKEPEFAHIKFVPIY